jgi:hypothetical protein
MAAGLALLMVVMGLLVREIRHQPAPHEPRPVPEQRVGMAGGDFTRMSVTDRFGAFRVTVTSVGTGIESMESGAGSLTPEGRFAVVHLTVKNTSRQPILVVATEFNLVDAHGQEYEPHREATVAAMVGNGLPVGGDLERAQVKSYINVYDVPAEFRPAELLVDSSLVSGRPTMDIRG